MIKWLFWVLLLCSFDAFSGQVLVNNSGIRIRTHYKFPSTLPPPKSANQCSQIFASAQYRYTIRDVTDSGGSSLENRDLPMDYQPFELQGLVSSIVKSWTGSKRYDDEYGQSLIKTDEAILPSRSHYIEINFRGEKSTVRITDGSEVPQFGDTPWAQVPGGELALTPIERNYDYRFPERDLAEPFIIELGLLGNPQTFEQGLPAIGHHIAEFLDSRYNNSSFKAFQSTEVIDQRKLKVYVVGRPAMARYHESLGFSKVKNSQGEDVRFADGLYLLEYSGGPFIRSFLKGNGLPQIEGYESEQHTAELGVQWETYLKRLDTEAMPILRDETHFWAWWNHKADTYYGEIFAAREKGEDYSNDYRMWMADLYQLYKSALAQNIRDQGHNRETLETLRWLLVQDPKLGFDHFLSIYMVEEVNLRIFNGEFH